MSDHCLFTILVNYQMWHLIFYHPNETHLSATILPLKTNYPKTPPITISGVSIALDFRVGLSFIFFQKLYQTGALISKGNWFLLIVLVVYTSNFWCLWETYPHPPPTNYLPFTNKFLFLLYLFLLSTSLFFISLPFQVDFCLV